MKTHVITFKSRFAPLVESCLKKQTVRPNRKRAIETGDILSLRVWTGRPYHSPQRILGSAVCTRVATIIVDSFGLRLDGEAWNLGNADRFAVLDGFANYCEMLMWFKAEHGLPFVGIVIKWDPL